MGYMWPSSIYARAMLFFQSRAKRAWSMDFSWAVKEAYLGRGPTLGKM